MKYLLLLLISFSVHSAYRVNEFPNYCDGGCSFESLGKCKEFLDENHPSIQHSECKDISSELAQIEIDKNNYKIENRRLRLKISNLDLSADHKKLLRRIVIRCLAE